MLNIVSKSLAKEVYMDVIPGSERQSRWMVPFFTIWTGQALSLLGSQLVQFALIWWLTITTGSATVLATASIVGILPQVLLGPFAGALVDRWSRRLTMILADLLIAGVTVVLAVLFALGVAQPWQVFLILFLRALAGTFHFPAMAASTSLMVPKEHLTRIQGANQTLQGGLNIVAAPLGALLLELLPMQGIVAIDVVTALLAVLPLLFIPVPQPPAVLENAVAGKSKPSVWEDLRAGVRYVWNWPGLFAIMIMAALINLVLNPAFALLPILVKNVFGGGAMHLAWIESTGGIGIVAGGLLLGVWGGFRRRIMTSLLGLVGIGLGTLVIGLAPAGMFPVAIAAFFFVGVMLPLTNGPLFAIVQAAVAPEMQGRVFTLIGSFATAMSPIGLAIAGPLSDTIGVRTWFWIGGAVTGVMALVSYMMPAVRLIEQQRPGVEPELPADFEPSPAAAGLFEID
jgi:MFS transporter, DHA3 family, macrolide efflux protein